MLNFDRSVEEIVIEYAVRLTVSNRHILTLQLVTNDDGGLLVDD
jgi:hypothetical protein